jgi:hypothetical protein
MLRKHEDDIRKKVCYTMDKKYENKELESLLEWIEGSKEFSFIKQIKK